MSDRSDSRQSHQNSQMGDDQGGISGYGKMEADNNANGDPLNNLTPFSLPDDELIFSFKEQEKLRREKEREANKCLKIWQKNRPTREGCLRKLTETDIEPSALAINPKVKKKINVAEAAGFNVPVDRQKNRENRYTLIEKKREMFLV